MIRYRLELSPDDNDTVLVTSSDLPGLVTYGEDRASALENAVDAAETLLARKVVLDYETTSLVVAEA
ncbi:hypothetical protein D1O30_07030 [Methylocystis hirsuta]|uniref:Type II toxin-antitoxin system HicB family antitoxin n=1 Tax=Methylocystis hirsuta TaxID=369798 RepID=A0A3M9XN18_9HYPH|nr:hypothetical protein D1O30_07030 [Methylocystis hirsuta]